MTRTEAEKIIAENEFLGRLATPAQRQEARVLLGHPEPLVAQWNTGRLYQRDGQRIGAELESDRKGVRVLFRDYSRMIDGEIAVVPGVPVPVTADRLKAFVMAAYDRTGGYRMSCEAGRLRWVD
jgi:hypothetical protein